MDKLLSLFEERLGQVVTLVKETNKLPVLIIQQHPADDGRTLLFPPVRESLSNIICFAEVSGTEFIKDIIEMSSDVVDVLILDIDYKRDNSEQIIEEVKSVVDSKPLLYYSDYSMWSTAAMSFILSIVKTIKNKKVLLLDNNFLTARVLQALLNYGANVYAPVDDYNNGTYSMDENTAMTFKSDRFQVPTDDDDQYDIIIGGSVLSQYKKDLSKYHSKHIFDIGLRNFSAEFIKEQMSQGATIYRFDNRAGISSVVLNLMETDCLTSKNMGTVKVGNITLVSGGILGEEDSIVVDNVFSPEFIFGVADGQGMFKENLSEANKKDIKIIESLIEK